MGFWILAAALAAGFLSFVLRPKPKKRKPDTYGEIDSPELADGVYMRYIAGTVTVAPHVIDYLDKDTYVYKVKA